MGVKCSGFSISPLKAFRLTRKPEDLLREYGSLAALGISERRRFTEG